MVSPDLHQKPSQERRLNYTNGFCRRDWDLGDDIAVAEYKNGTFVPIEYDERHSPL